MIGHLYTPEERAFFMEYVSGHSHKEIQSEFIERFGWSITLNQVKAYIKNHKLNTGRTGRFVKGQPSYDKGKKGQYAPGSEKGWFDKGHMPVNHRPVGSERISVDGYAEVKIAEPNKWRLKHLVVWEKENGSVPSGHCIIFLDSDKQNFSLDNLMLISRKTLVRMNQQGLFFTDPELTKTGVRIAEVASATGDAKRRRRAK